MTRAAIGPVALVILVAGLVAVSWGGCKRRSADAGSPSVLAQPADSAVSFSEVLPFALTERSGALVTRDELLGHAWVASMVYTRCTGPCPSVVVTLKKLQGRMKGIDGRIVTFSVDPQWDTPEVLSRYADAAGAEKKRWLFLTGDEKTIDELIRASFQVPVERSAEAPIGQSVAHNTRLVAVDKKGRVRGFYHGESDDELELLLARLRFLERETP